MGKTSQASRDREASYKRLASYRPCFKTSLQVSRCWLFHLNSELWLKFDSVAVTGGRV